MTQTSQISLQKQQEAIDTFWETVPPVWGQVREAIRKIVTANFDITAEQFHILRHLRKGVNSMSDLAKNRHISRPAVSQAVDLLVGKGLIIRQENPVDRRFVNLELTPAGRDLINAIFQKNREWMMSRLTLLTPVELEDLMLGLHLMKKTFGEPDE